jgi:hypothetical protein
MSSAFVLSGSLMLFAIDCRKYHLSHSHSHKHKHDRQRTADASRPRTPGVASEQNTGEGVDGIELQLEEECPPSCRVRDISTQQPQFYFKSRLGSIPMFQRFYVKSNGICSL